MGLKRYTLGFIIGALAGLLWCSVAHAQPMPVANVSASLSSTSCPGTGCVALGVVGRASLAVQVTGSWSGTITFEGSVDGSTYQALNVTATNGSSAVTTTTANGVWVGAVGGLASVRARMSAFSSGTAVVSLQGVEPGGGSGGGGGGGGSDVTIHDPNTVSQKVAVNASGQMSITCANCSGSGASAVDNSAFTAGATSGAPAMGFYHSTIDTVTDGDTATVAIDSKRNQFEVLRDAAGNARGANVTAGNALVVDGSASTQPVSGTFWQATQPVSGTVTANQGGTWTVQPGNTANTTAWKVDGSAVTQPVSGTVTANAGSGTFNIQANASTNVAQLAGTATSVNSGTKDAGTLRVVLATDQPQLTNKLLVTPDSVALPANQSVNVSQIAGTNTVTAGVSGLLAVGGNIANGVTATANPVPVGGVFTTAPTTLTTGQTATAQFTAAQNLKADVSTIAGTAPTTAGKLDVKGADGDVFVRQATAGNLNATVVGTGTFVVQATDNVTQFGGTNLSTGTGTGGAGIPRVTVSSDSSLTANAGTNLNTSALALSATQTDGTQKTKIVDGSGNVIASTSNALNVQCANCSGSGASATDGASFTAGASTFAPSGAEYTDTAVAMANGTQAMLRSTAYRAEHVNLRDNNGAEIGIRTNPEIVSDLVLAQLLAAIQKNGTRLSGAFGRAITSTGDALDVNVKYQPATIDPCAGSNKLSVAISQTGNARLLTQPAGRVYICSAFVVGADAENLSLVEGTGSTCGTGTVAVVGGATAANGPNFAANGGFTLGNGAGTVAITTTAGNDVCLFQSGAGRVAGVLTVAVR